MALLIVGPPLDADTTAQVAQATGAACLAHEREHSGAEMQLYGGLDGLYYHPPIARDTLLCWMRQADVLLNTSESEGQCNALLEAAAVGCPRLARQCTGNASLVRHGQTGMLFSSPEEAEVYLLQLLEAHPSSTGADTREEDGGECTTKGCAAGQARHRNALAGQLADAAAREVQALYDPSVEVAHWHKLLDEVLGLR